MLKNGAFSEAMFSNGTPLFKLANEIDIKIKEKSWSKFFIKHSTRSSKDSPLLIRKAHEDFVKIQEIKNEPLEENMILFTALFAITFTRQQAEKLLNFWLLVIN